MPTVPGLMQPLGQSLNPVAQKPTQENLLMALAIMNKLGKLDSDAPGPALPKSKSKKILK